MDVGQELDAGNVNIGGVSIGVKQFQNIYSAITGKTEALEGLFGDSHCILLSDIDNLYSKLKQIVDIKEKIGDDCTVTIYHCSDKKEIFTGYERFKLYNIGRVSPVENVFLEYVFAIKISDTKNVENYKVKVNLHSRVGQACKAKNSPNYFPGFISMFNKRTGSYRIEHVNYVVAREIEAAIAEWYAGLEKNATGNLLGFFKTYSHETPRVFQVLSIIGSSFWFLKYFYQDNPPIFDVRISFYLTCCFISLISCVCILSRQAGVYVENAIDSIFPLSYVSINKGDEAEIRKYSSKNKKNLGIILATIVATILLNIVSTWIGIKIGVG